MFHLQPLEKIFRFIPLLGENSICTPPLGRRGAGLGVDPVSLNARAIFPWGGPSKSAYDLLSHKEISIFVHVGVDLPYRN